jgi:hypothetical protein
MLDVCLYELGCVELNAHTRGAILDELGRDTVYKTSAKDFPETATALFQFISSSPDFQFA